MSKKTKTTNLGDKADPIDNVERRERGMETRERYDEPHDISSATDAITDILHTLAPQDVERVLQSAKMHHDEESATDYDALARTVDALLAWGAECNAKGDWDHGDLALHLERLLRVRRNDCENCRPGGNMGSCPICWQATGNGCPHDGPCENCADEPNAEGGKA